MKVDEQTYEKVAERCHAFSPAEKNSSTNSHKDENHVSCCCCKHFDSHEHCVLDLYDKIVDEVE